MKDQINTIINDAVREIQSLPERHASATWALRAILARNVEKIVSLLTPYTSLEAMEQVGDAFERIKGVESESNPIRPVDVVNTARLLAELERGAVLTADAVKKKMPEALALLKEAIR